MLAQLRCGAGALDSGRAANNVTPIEAPNVKAAGGIR
jgi:hypothetical protein